MRIIAGTWRSRRIEAPAGMSTRPTLDKVREAVFSMLGGSFDGGSFLDLYAGSGANGLEALSRGMESAVFTDKDHRAVSVIKKNINSLGCNEQCRVLAMTDVKALNLLHEEKKQFSFIYMDPPYAKQKNTEILRLIDDFSLLEKGGTIVIESARDDTFNEDCGNLVYFKDRVYGMTRITLYRKKEEKTHESMLSGNL